MEPVSIGVEVSLLRTVYKWCGIACTVRCRDGWTVGKAGPALVGGVNAEPVLIVKFGLNWRWEWELNGVRR